MPVLFDKPNYFIEHTDKGIYFVCARGKFTVDTLEEFKKDAWPHLERLAPVLYLNDASQIGEATLGAKWGLSRLVKQQARWVKKSAVFGVSPALRLAVGAVLRAAGRDNVKICATREEAEAYLLGPD